MKRPLKSHFGLVESSSSTSACLRRLWKNWSILPWMDIRFGCSNMNRISLSNPRYSLRNSRCHHCSSIVWCPTKTKPSLFQSYRTPRKTSLTIQKRDAIWWLRVWTLKWQKNAWRSISPNLATWRVAKLLKIQKVENRELMASFGLKILVMLPELWTKKRQVRWNFNLNGTK